MEILSKEFKENVKNVAKNAVDAAVDLSAKFKENASKTIDSIEKSDVVQETKKKVSKTFNISDVEKKIYAKRDQRNKEKVARQKENDFVKATIEKIRNREDVVEIYSQRSQMNETTSFSANECLVTAKVTVIGVVRQLANGKYRLQISMSRRNPLDVYNKRYGYMTALERAINPTGSFEIEGHMFETIKVGDFDTPILKSVFMPIADNLIAQYEYDIIRYKKALANSILAES